MSPSASGLAFVFRRLLTAGLLAALPVACAGPVGGPGGEPAGGSELTGPPPDAEMPGSQVTMGASGLGNYLAGRMAQGEHDTSAAARFFGRALAEDPDNVELLQRAYALMAAEGQLGAASDLARRVLAFDQDASLAAMLVAVDDAAKGDFAASEKAMATQPRRGIITFMAPLLVAWARVGQGQTDSALEALAPLASNSSVAALYEFHAGLVADLAGRNKVAEEHYAATVASNAGLTLRAVQAVGSFYQRTGRMTQARDLYQRYQDQYPDTNLLEPAGLLAQGDHIARPVASAKDGMAEALFGAASSVRQNNANDVALMFGHLALALAPDYQLAQVLVADILQAQGRLPDADRIYAGIKAGSPIWWSAQLRIANNLDELGDVEGSIKLLRGLAAARPDRADAMIELGELYRRHKRFEEAAAAYDAAIQRAGPIDNRHWSLFYSRGISLERSHQWARAESDFLKALELEPNEPYVLNYLGYSWVEQGINLAQARAMIEKAVSLRPRDGFIVDSLGWVQYRLGDYTSAVVTLDKAVELHPEDATINDHLGDALWRVGRREEARFQWTRSQTLAPEPELVESLKHKLADGLPDEKTATGSAK